MTKRAIAPKKKAISVKPTAPNLPLTPIDAEALTKALQKRGETLEKIMLAILPEEAPRERARYQQVLALTADGKTWREVSAETGLQWVELSTLNFSAQWRQAWSVCQTLGEQHRVAIREATAHDRAINGHDKPIYQGGQLVGHVNEVDNRLLEFLLKSDNPKKYNPPPAQQQGNACQQIVILHRDMVRDPRTITVPVEADRDDAPPKTPSP
jgi:hypothetical protein